MPVIRLADSLDPGVREQLVAMLAAELATVAATGSGPEPVVYENPIPPTERFLAVVVWSRWDVVSWGLRTGIILEAYSRADAAQSDRPPRAPHLATASGLTWDEADENGFFKYAVRLSDGSDRSQAADDAMIAAGGVRTEDGVKLRLLTLRDAKVALNTVVAAAPHANWLMYRVSDSEA